MRTLFVITKKNLLPFLAGFLLMGNSLPVYSITSENMRAINLDAPIYFGGEFSQTCSEGSEASLEVDKNFSLGENPQERRTNLMRVLMADYGLTAEQAAGPIGNFMQESGGSHLPPDVNEGQGAGPPQFSGGYGWAQWTGPRQRSFIEFAIADGYMGGEQEHATDAANYAYLKKELSEGYTDTIPELKQQSSPGDAAVSFEDTFEKAGRPNMSNRIAFAEQAYDEFNNSGASGSTESSGNTCSTESGSAAVVGDNAFPLRTTKPVIQNPEMFRNGTAEIGGHPYTAYDIMVPSGTSVGAFLSGTVSAVSEDKCPGRLISIYNEESDLTVSYLHLSHSNHISQGETVSAGEEIGVVGTADEGCGVPHLHIDVANGTSRPGCSRENCPRSNQEQFVDIGAELYATYQELPD